MELEGLGLSDGEIAAINELNPEVPQAPTAPRPSPKRKLQPARDNVLSILSEVGLPMLSRDIQTYARTKYGIVIEATRFGSLRRSEMDAYDRQSQRPLWLAYGLTASGEAVKRLLARSDVPLVDRVVGPLSGRRLFFETTARLCEILMKEEQRIEDVGAFRIFVADHSRDLPGLKNFQKGLFPVPQWLTTAQRALDAVEGRDLQDRKHIALRLTMLGDKQRLFGMELPAEDHSIDPPITAETLAR